MSHLKDCQPQYFGHTSNKEMLLMIHPALALMIAWTNVWCLQRGITPVWTSIIRNHEQNLAVGAVSKTHLQGRAADLDFADVYGWNDSLRDQFEFEFFTEFEHLGALKNNDGELISRPIVGPSIDPVNHDDHFHVQCRPNIERIYK